MAGDSHFATCQARVEAALREALPPQGERPARLNEAIRYSVLVGGKRLRPILTLLAAEAVGGKWEAALPAAVAVELLHTYTLVHDDLPCMDNDLLRRGEPTVHAKYGEGLAVLVGDALQTLAFERLVADPTTPPALAMRWVAELAAAAGPRGVIGGQVEDIAAAGQRVIDAATLDYIHQHKTADLFRAAMRLGALGGGATAAQVEQLGGFGSHLGHAFQIIDDLLDAAVPEVDEEPELSCLMLWTPAEARRVAAAATDAALAQLAGLPGPVEPLVNLAQQMLQRIN